MRLPAAILIGCLLSTSATAGLRGGGHSGGVCTALPGNTPDGTTIHSMTGGTVKTVYGTFGFGDYYVDRGSGLDPDRYPVLNGRPIENPSGIEGAPITCRVMMVLNCGQLACQTLSSVWNGWSSNSWAYEADLSAPVWYPLPPAQVTPPFTPSPDGTTITGGTGSLTSEDGVWTFGPAVVGGGWRLRLNGAAVGVAGGDGEVVDTIEINSYGRVWARAISGSWELWQGQYIASFFAVAGDGNASVPPPTSSPIPIRLFISPPAPNPAEYNGTLSGTATMGTVIGTLTLNLSDGSTGSCGAGGVVCNVGANAAGHVYAGFAGNDVVMAVNGVPDCGGGLSQHIPLSFTANGVTIYKLYGVNPVGC